MKNLLFGLFFSVFGSLVIGCVHSPIDDEGPWSLIKNEDARRKYMMVQAAAGSMSYKKLYFNIKLLNDLYPNEDIITITYAGIHGDYGQTLSEEQQQEYKTQALQMLKPFINQNYPSKISQQRILAYNQYYYHSGQFEKQYEYGKEIIKLGGQGGEVLVGVGGSMRALELDRNNKIFRARVLALEARQIWENLYDLSIPQMREAAYQNSFYISTLALTGECSQAQIVFDTTLTNSPHFSELKRWYQKFNPKNINNCQSQRQLTGK